LLPEAFFTAKNSQKCVLGRGAPPDALGSKKGNTTHIQHQLDAFGISILGAFDAGTLGAGYTAPVLSYYKLAPMTKSVMLLHSQSFAVQFSENV